MITKSENIKVAIVTGGSSGIGLSAAKILARSGFNIAICSRNRSKLIKASKEILNNKSQCFFRSVDVSKESEVINFFNEVYSFFGRIDVLINNAGKQLNKPFMELSSHDWNKIIKLNLYGYVYCCKSAGKYMIQQGSGKIINISSVLSRFALPGRAPYSVSKAGIEALTRVLSSEWAKHNILVNAIAPGHIDTELVREDINKGLLDYESIKKRSLLNRMGDPDDVGMMVEFLSSEKSNFITGQTFTVDGGFSIKK